MKLKDQLKTLEGTEKFVKKLSRDCRNNLLEILNKIEKEEREEVKKKNWIVM